MPIDFVNEQDQFNKALGESAAIKSTKPVTIVPKRPTIRLEFVKTKNGKRTGPYYYAYWREGKKVKKKYLGRNLAPNLQAIYHPKADDPGRVGADIAAAMESIFLR